MLVRLAISQVSSPFVMRVYLFSPASGLSNSEFDAVPLDGELVKV